MIRTRSVVLRAVRLAAIALMAGSFLAIGGVAAEAAPLCPSNPSCAGSIYYVQGTDGTLAIQSQPAVDHVVGWLREGDPIRVFCQVNNGGTDPYDGLSSRTWDEISGGRWVYDTFVSTPPQGPDGFSPGVPHC
jgi:hypothetical protein